MPPMKISDFPTECELCGKTRSKAQQMDRHHTSYKDNEWIALCQKCHTKVHANPKYFDDLQPEMTRREAEEAEYDVT